jgi:hypothetical protein
MFIVMKLSYLYIALTDNKNKRIFNIDQYFMLINFTGKVIDILNLF